MVRVGFRSWLLGQLCAIFLAACATTQPTTVIQRDPAQVRTFRKDHPCPATGKTDGACPGWIIDHVYSLCLGGPDIPENMAWQAYDESLVKDKYEKQMCAMKRKLEKK